MDVFPLEPFDAEGEATDVEVECVDDGSADDVMLVVFEVTVSVPAMSLQGIDQLKLSMKTIKHTLCKGWQ